MPATENRAAPRKDEHGADVGDGANNDFTEPYRNGREPLPPESCGALIIEFAMGHYQKPEPYEE